MKEEKNTTELCRQALSVQTSPAGSMRMQAALDRALAEIDAAPPRPVMTLPEVANYLRVTPDEIAEHLEQLPCFEFAGKLLFQKDAIDTWITQREQHYKGDIISFNSHQTVQLNIA